MKRLTLIILAVFLFQQSIFAEVSVYSENNKFGLQDEQKQHITDAKYKKIIRLGDHSWIMQKGNKFGVIDDEGSILVKPVYDQAERIAGKYVKFRKGSKYCLLNEKGYSVLGTNDSNKNKMFNSIDLLPGGLIVTSKGHKYGLSSFNGDTYLDNIFDDIYMKDNDTIVIVYGSRVMEFSREDSSEDGPFCFVFRDLQNAELKLSDLATSPLATTGYYSVTFTDYVLKLFSSISPAYEQTIDELMLSQGADTVSVLIKCSWLPKFPFVYAKNYYNNVTDPSNGPLNKAKKNLRQQIKE